MADHTAATTAPASGDDESVRYFCHQCQKEVAVAGAQDGMTCSECEGGFVEAMSTAAPEFRRPSRRRRRRAHDAVPLPQQMLQMVQILLEASRENSNRQGGNAHDSGGLSPADTVEEGEVLTARSGDEEDAGGSTAAAGDGEGDGDGAAAGNEGRVVIVRERQDDNSDDPESDSETGGLRLELEGFDLNEDEEEWEEAEEEDGAITARVDAEIAGDEYGADHGGDREDRVSRARNNLTLYMRELFQNIVDHNLEVRLELPDMYIGNPGDYLDSRGFEQLLQQLAENDNTRRGAPPAAKSAVDDLGLTKITQHHIDSGIAVCAICKEHLMLDEPAKQLPCLHLYHQDCILPWLSSRNSCPVCRYELPTDDPDYEEQKKSRRVQENSGSTDATTADVTTATGEEDGSNASDRGQNSGGGSEESCRDSEVVVPENRAGYRGISRSWLILAVGPVLSVMGFMFISLANHLAGRQADQLFHEFQAMFHSNYVQGRHWWFH